MLYRFASKSKVLSTYKYTIKVSTVIPLESSYSDQTNEFFSQFRKSQTNLKTISMFRNLTRSILSENDVKGANNIYRHISNHCKSKECKIIILQQYLSVLMDTNHWKNVVHVIKSRKIDNSITSFVVRRMISNCDDSDAIDEIFRFIFDGKRKVPSSIFLKILSTCDPDMLVHFEYFNTMIEKRLIKLNRKTIRIVSNSLFEKGHVDHLLKMANFFLNFPKNSKFLPIYAKLSELLYQKHEFQTLRDLILSVGKKYNVFLGDVSELKTLLEFLFVEKKDQEFNQILNLWCNSRAVDKSLNEWIVTQCVENKPTLVVTDPKRTVKKTYKKFDPTTLKGRKKLYFAYKAKNEKKKENLNHDN
jgi:hypothetical protein